MQDSTRSKPKGYLPGFLPIPRTIACFVILLTALAFIVGRIRGELTLTLLGTIFFVILVYCFLGVFFLGLVHRRKAQCLSMSIVPESVNAGENGELFIKTIFPGISRFWKLPAILIRCELYLETDDSRVIRHFVNPETDKISSISVKERGVYFGEQDRFVIFDAPGFFRLYLPIQQSTGPRLFALPSIGEPISLLLKSGGTVQRNDFKHNKSEELIDHRPYYPGDDPRRINWKLYSHSPLGELMVRKEDVESPPHSRRIILIDAEVDQSLYTIDEGRRAVDLLCECVLSAALEFSARGIDVSIGYNGSKIIGDHDEGKVLSLPELARTLAWPAAVFRPGVYLPKPPEGHSVFIFALPRTILSEGAAIEDFIGKHRQEMDIVFLYDINSWRAAELEEAARLSVSIYNRRQGINAEKAAVFTRGAL